MRTFYSEWRYIGTLGLGEKKDIEIATWANLPQGCQVEALKAIHYEGDFRKPDAMSPIQPPEATHDHRYGPVGHGWTVTRLTSAPRDLGAKIHLWYDPYQWLVLRVVWEVREPDNLDCFVSGTTRTYP